MVFRKADCGRPSSTSSTAASTAAAFRDKGSGWNPEDLSSDLSRGSTIHPCADPLANEERQRDGGDAAAMERARRRPLKGALRALTV